MLSVFVGGMSKANPGDSGIGIVIFNGKELKEEVFEYSGKKMKTQAEYMSVIRTFEKLKEFGEKSAIIFSDAEFMIKQLNGQIGVKSEKIKPYFDKVMEISKEFDVKFLYIPSEDNKKANDLALKAIADAKKKVSQNLSVKLKLDKAFFGKVNCLKVQMNMDNEVYFHMGLLNQKTKEWIWKKVKMSDVELGELINLLRKEMGKCSFFHTFGASKTQIWCNKTPQSFTIKIVDVSKNLTIGEFEVLRLVLEEAIRVKCFSC